jgi:hypothetical protein
MRQLDQHRSGVANVPRHSGENQRRQGFTAKTSGQQFNGNRSSETGIYIGVLGLSKEEEEVGGAKALIKILLLSAPSRLSLIISLLYVPGII